MELVRSRLAACLAGAVLVLSGCAANGAADAPSAERTVTELAPPPASDPPSANPSGPRPANGATVLARGTSGRGDLTVDNGTDRDALITLSLDGTAVRAVYVRGSSSADLRGIPDGTYDIFVTQGDGWNRELRRFTASPEYSKFAQTAPFQTVRESDGVRYTHLRVTLRPVTSGPSSTNPVDADAYPN